MAPGPARGRLGRGARVPARRHPPSTRRNGPAPPRRFGRSRNPRHLRGDPPRRIGRRLKLWPRGSRRGRSRTTRVARARGRVERGAKKAMTSRRRNSIRAPASLVALGQLDLAQLLHLLASLSCLSPPIRLAHPARATRRPPCLRFGPGTHVSAAWDASCATSPGAPWSSMPFRVPRPSESLQARGAWVAPLLGVRPRMRRAALHAAIEWPRDRTVRCAAWRRD